MRATAWVWISAGVLAALVFVACGGGGTSKTSAPKTTVAASTTTVKPQDIVMTAAMFHNIHRLTKVDDHFVGNLLGHLPETLAVAHSKSGGTYPVGTILQFIPQEAMVKRAKGFSPTTSDWEFFSLNATPKGTTILTRGGAQVLNRFGQSCASCHAPAAGKFDMVCGQDHGCAPLPASPSFFKALQESDPRPR